MKRTLVTLAAAAAWWAPVAGGLGRLGRDDYLVRELAAEARATGLREWGLVEYVRVLVAERFTTYSWADPFASPSAAMRRGAGFATHYNGALADVLAELGFRVEPVFAARISLDRPWWRRGHTWLRVWIDGEPASICAIYCDGPGELQFHPTTEVRPFRARTRIVTSIVIGAIAAAPLWRRRLTGAELPAWCERPMV